MVEKVKLPSRDILPNNATCTHCVNTLADALRDEQGVLNVHQDGVHTICVHYDTDVTTADTITRTARLRGADVQSRYRQVRLAVDGLDCGSCAQTLEESLRRLPGVVQARASVATGDVFIEWDTAYVDEDEITAVLHDLGHIVREPTSEEETPTTPPAWCLHAPLLFGVGAFVGGLLLSWRHTTPWESVAFALAMLAAGAPIARRGVQAFRRSRRLTIDALMTIAAIGAALLGEWGEGAAVVVLFAIGEWLEHFAMERARHSVRSLMELVPDTAHRLLPDGTTETVPARALRVGDTILVRPGERIPADGVVVAGQSAVNQAPVTGESMPVFKTVGDPVFSGTVNGEGVIEVRITRPADQSTIARIVALVQDAQSRKAESERMVDRFAARYTPAVVVGAIVLAIVLLLVGLPPREAMLRALVLLVISCPCALVISTPVSVLSAISGAARHGVLIKGGRALEALGRVRVVAIDKTGTLTRGEPRVTNIIPLEGDRETLLRLAAAVEARSEHPLARAVVAAAEEEGLAVPPAQAVRTLTGRGITGVVNGRTVRIGTRDLFEHIPDIAVDHLHRLENEAKTTMLVAQDERILGIIAVADTIRAEAKEAVAALHRLGIERVVLLTGDNETTARAVAAQVGIDDVRAGLLPEEKSAAVEALHAQYGAVAMVGDGINDAPALATADVGIAMGAAGTHQAIETADVALMSDDLRKIAYALRLGRAARRTIAANILFSVGIKLLFMALAIPGWTTLWLAVLADDGASLLVTANGLRLRRVRG
ncbi:Cd2+/Zn2+-exporting ATPase [Ardenticatena maritima]|uniref:P-type Cu(+) transporter n=1 Tax=Ardenticatena maritima TaxID=872965 RepID=A0A0M9UDJ6_9CHLR|nr:cation-translocating P-type ATPase [Ardenticatena maritima]GAP64047.1 Cd2+/Zn2+-exporting ATPase [Ardenticatena maritima]